MTITSFPINTIPPAANLIANTPAGSVSATDVQAAINQLAGLIPSPGPGTDPLSLLLGFQLTTFNPTALSNSSDRWGSRVTYTTDCAQTDPQFSNNSAAQFLINATNGDNTNGAVTVAKQSFFAINNAATYWAAGQKFVQRNDLTAYGMGDSAIWANNAVRYWGGPVNGDEGQGFGLASLLQQGTQLATTTISAYPTQAVINTTINQIGGISKSKNAQTVTVVSTAGLVSVGTDPNQWVVIDQEAPNGSPNLEAVKVISFTATSITGVFRNNHNNGATVTPALRFSVGDVHLFGQQRVVVNYSRPSYSTGLVSSISGGGFTGNASTNWANNMVGGNATNIGAISLAADDCTTSPFNVGPAFKSFYQINTVVGVHSLGIFSFSVAGDGSYYGAGPGAGTYVIRPAARVLHMGTDANGALTGEVVCETSALAWVNGDSVECVICPYPDVTGFQYGIAHYSRGGAGVRAFMHVRNNGIRSAGTCFTVDDIGLVNQAGGDGRAWDNIISLSAPSYTALLVDALCTRAAIQLGMSDGASRTDIGGAIVWGSNTATSPNLMVNSVNQALTLATVVGYTAPNGKLVFARNGTGENPETNQYMMKWNGYLQIVKQGSENQMIQLDNVTDAVNFEHGFLRWKSSNLEIGTEKGGTGSARDMIVKTNGVEQMRFIAGGTVQFSGAPSFSANGSVATVLGSVGPPGANTTVQEWLTIKNPAGVTRYIQCF